MTETLAQVQRLLPEIAKRSEQIERDRRIPPDLIAAMQEAGCYRMLVPACHGGDEVALAEVLKVIEAVASADGATGWALSQAASSQLIFAHFPSSTIAEIYASGPDSFGAGAVAPKGQAVAQEGGWRVSGQWPYATGCQLAPWVYVQCVLVENRKVCMLPQGIPAVRMMLFPSSEARIIDTWQVVGLLGTGSHDIALSAAFCPAERSANLLGSQATLSGPSYAISLLDQGGLLIAAVALGIAGSAIQDLAEVASAGKRPAFTRERLAQSAVFQDQLGGAYLELEGAHALLYTQADRAWMAATGDRPALTLLERATLRATPASVIAAAARIVNSAYTLAGGTALYNRCSLQRRLRDVHAATQHVYAGRHSFGIVGALVAGESIDGTVF